jgi:nucleoside-diphosphate-sugar epimerase
MAENSTQKVCAAQRKESSVETVGTIAVAGATGRVGRHVVDVLEEQGHDVVAISP